MTILPVLDILHGTVVHGIAGERESYRPIQSRLTDSTDPLSIASAIRDEYSLSRFYLADLDGLMRTPVAPDLRSTENIEGLYQCEAIKRLTVAGFDLVADIGVQSLKEAIDVLDCGASEVVVALESLPSLELLSQCVSALGAERVVFSLDLKLGEPILSATMGERFCHRAANCGRALSLEVATAAIAAGVRRLLLLDLSAVGSGQGVPTLPLCQELRRLYPDLKLLSGGGVRGAKDIHEAAMAGVNELLVASALHQQQLTCQDIR